jgi:hypothetical protein
MVVLVLSFFWKRLLALGLGGDSDNGVWFDHLEKEGKERIAHGGGDSPSTLLLGSQD